MHLKLGVYVRERISAAGAGAQHRCQREEALGGVGPQQVTGRAGRLRYNGIIFELQIPGEAGLAQLMHEKVRLSQRKCFAQRSHGLHT